MNYKNYIHKISNSIIYLLIAILGFLIFYTLIQYSSNKTPKTEPPNSISVSPLTGERLERVISDDLAYSVKYKSSNLKDLYKIYDSDIVYEFYNSKTNFIEYSATFFNNPISSNEQIESMNTVDLSILPKFNFTDVLSLENFNFSENSDVIYIKYNEDLNSNFLYKDGLYTHFSSKLKDKHYSTNKDLSYSNIIVQFVDENFSNDISKISTGSGKGLLFVGGKVQNIFWKDSKFYLSDNSTELTLLRGKTYWISLSNKDNLVFNQSTSQY